MRTVFIAIVAMGLIALAVGCTTVEDRKKDQNKISASSFQSINLFNGKDLKGWCSYLATHTVFPEQVWFVKDGLLICKGEPMGYIYTEKSFRNFKLIVEWRWAPGKEPGNSGIFMRLNREPRPLPRAIECQLRSGNAGDLYAFHGMKLNGDPQRLRKIQAHILGGDITGLTAIASAEKSPGQWNRAEIIVVNDRIQVVINDIKVNEAWECEVIEGPIGLQSEGGEIHFRRVEIIPL